MSPARVVYCKPYHLPIEIEHRAWWAIKMLNYDLTEPGEERQLQLSELDESARSYKERAKLFHNKHILRKEFSLGMKVLLYDSKLHIFLGKLRSR